LLAIALPIGCADDEGDDGAAPDAEDTGDRPDGGDDPSDAGVDPATSDGDEEPGDEGLSGPYSLASWTDANGTFTPEWQNAPWAGQPNREVQVTGIITLRADGSYTRIVKLAYRDPPFDEADLLDEDASDLFSGTWRLEGERLLIQDDGEEEPDIWTYAYDETDERLVLDRVGSSEDQPEQVVWQRQRIDPDLVATWDLVSLEQRDVGVLTTENQEVDSPWGTVNARVEGWVEVAGDGSYSRVVALFIDDSQADDLDEDGLSYTADGIWVLEEPQTEHLEFEYEVDPGGAGLTQRDDDSEDIVEMIWTRRE
jgi:hypothetical protein